MLLEGFVSVALWVGIYCFMVKLEHEASTNLFVFFFCLWDELEAAVVLLTIIQH